MTKIRKPLKGWLRVLLILIPFGFFVGMSQTIAMLVLKINISDRHFVPTTFQSVVLETFMLLGVVAVVAIFRKWVDRENFRSIGFLSGRVIKELEIGLWLGVSMIATGFLLLLMFHEINWIGTNPDTLNLLLSVVLFVAVAFTEEIFFRGYVLNNLMGSMNRWIALSISAVFFSLLHMGNAHFTVWGFLSIILAGLLLGLPYIYTKSLWLPISLHFSWNFFQGTIFGFSVSGNNEYSLITQSRKADTIWNGGQFGFEGSILAVAFLTLAILLMGLSYHRKEKLAGTKAQPPVVPPIQ